MRLERWALVALLGVVGCDGPPPAVAPRAEVRGHSAEVVALTYTPDGQKLISRGADAIRIWDAGTLRELGVLPSDGAEFGGLAVSPDGRTVAATLVGRGVVTWNLADRAESTIYRAGPATARPDGAEAFGWGLTYAPDGATLAGPAEDGKAGSSIQLWDVASREPAGLGPPGRPATHLAFTPDGRTLVAKGMEGSLRIYDVASRTERRSIDAGLSYLTAIAVNPDGRVVASSGSDRYLRLWEIVTGTQVGRLRGHLKAILGVAFHPDGRHAVTGDSAGTIFLWDVPAQRVVAQFKGHQGKVWALAFRPDGRELASAGEDRHVRTWDAAQALAAHGR